GRAAAELLVVDRQDERRRAALLLHEARQVAVARDAEHLESLRLDGPGERADAEAARVLGAEILVDDDDREAELHAAWLLLGGSDAGERAGQRSSTRGAVRCRARIGAIVH